MASYLDLIADPATSEIAGYALDFLRHAAHELIGSQGFGSSTPDWFLGSSTGDAGVGSSTPDWFLGSSTGDVAVGSSTPLGFLGSST
ncbi:hypothetical protein ACL02S_07295 [Nocardia sp. 004]|uniref:hypothetical protein n=1 Tax=Nocardia sp. 004 TaxID=3385978 RepID=UPI0039A25FBC